MNLSPFTLIAAARALDESIKHLERAIKSGSTDEPYAPELILQTERAREEVELRYNALRADTPSLPDFKEWLGYSG